VLVARANDDFGQAEPARFAANAFAANGSPVYLYRFSYVQTAMREQMRAGAPHGVRPVRPDDAAELQSDSGARRRTGEAGTRW